MGARYPDIRDEDEGVVCVCVYACVCVWRGVFSLNLGRAHMFPAHQTAHHYYKNDELGGGAQTIKRHHGRT